MYYFHSFSFDSIDSDEEDDESHHEEEQGKPSPRRSTRRSRPRRSDNDTKNNESSDIDDDDDDDDDDSRDGSDEDGSSSSGSSSSDSSSSGSSTSSSKSSDEDADNKKGGIVDNGDTERWDPNTEEAESFLDIFRLNHREANSNTAFLNAALEYVDSVDIRFVHLCLNELGAARKAPAPTARNNLKIWIKADNLERPLVTKSMAELKKVAIQRLGEDHKVRGQTIGAYRANLVKALREAMGETSAEGSLEHRLMVEMLRSSFLKPLKKKGGEEGTSKYTLAGQRAERPILKELFSRLESRNDDGYTRALYQPGLVRKHEENATRTSADGVIVTVHESHGRRVDPVEVKSRVSKNSFHRMIRRLKSVEDDGESDSGPVWGAQHFAVDKEHMYYTSIDLDQSGRPSVHPNLHKLVPDSKELIQCIHHAYVYGCKNESASCYLAFGDKRSLLGSILIEFSPRVMEAYGKILKYSYDKTFSWAYQSGNDNVLPEVPELVQEAFKNEKLKDLKMTDEAFLTFFGLWWRVNVPLEDGTDAVYFPIPKTARMVPIVVAIWNAMKGGVDAATQNLERCQEKVGVRSENNTVCARILLYHALVFHRIYQAISATKEIDDYPTIHHFRNTASHRSTFADSVERLQDVIIRAANQDQHVGTPTSMPNPTGIYAPSPGPAGAAKSRSKKKKRKAASTETALEMPPGRTSIGVTPGKGSSLDELPKEFVDRCTSCLGIFYGKRVKSPDDEEEEDVSSDSSDDEDNTDGKKKTKKAKDNRLRSPCHLCRALTDYVCNGCGRTLCFKPPQKKNLDKVLSKRNNGKKKASGSGGGNKGKSKAKNNGQGSGKKKGKKKGKSTKKKPNPEMVQPRIKSAYPSKYRVDVPMTVNGRIKIDKTTKEPVFETYHGEYTCYHIAHKEAWKKHLYEKEQSVIQQRAAYQEQEEERTQTPAAKAMVTVSRKKNKRSSFD